MEKNVLKCGFPLFLILGQRRKETPLVAMTHDQIVDVDVFAYKDDKLEFYFKSVSAPKLHQKQKAKKEGC